MPDKYDFRVLIKTVKGREFSYMTSSFFNSDVDTNYAVSASEVYNRITGSRSCSYHDSYTVDITAGGFFKTLQTFKDNNFLSASLNGGEESGSISFIYTGVKVRPDKTKDTLAKFKFFGSKVCDVLNLTENFWYRPSNFILNSGSNANYFSGDVDAPNLNVTNNFKIAGGGSLSSDLPIIINKETSRWLTFLNVSGSDNNQLPHADLKIGYDDTTNTYMISASARENDSTKFVIDGVTSLNVTHLTSSYVTSSVKQQFTEITSSGNSLFGNNKADYHDFMGNVSIRGNTGSLVGTISHSVDGLTILGNISASHNLFLNGDITASFISASDAVVADRFFSSGSDGAKVPHLRLGRAEFGGSVNIGSISHYANTNSAINFYVPADKIHVTSSLFVVESNLIACGSISASSGININRGTAIKSYNSAGAAREVLMYTDSNILQLNDSNLDAETRIFGQNAQLELVNGGMEIKSGDGSAGHITASGNISGSGTGSFTGGGDFDGRVNINSQFAQLRLSDDNFSDWLSIGQQGTVGYIKTSDADNNFKIRRGSDNTDLLSIDFSDNQILLSGSVTSSGDFLVQSQNIFLGGGGGSDEVKLIHNGDNDTHLLFDDNKVNLVAGNSSVIKLEKSTGKIFINNSNHDLDFQVMGSGGDEILHVDAAKHSIGIGTTTPPASGSNGHLFVVAGDISASGFISTDSHITASGNISSSGTGIFDKLEIHGADGTLAADYIIHKDDSNTKFGFPQNDKFKIQTDGTNRYVVDTTHTFTGNTFTDGNISASGDLVVGNLSTKPYISASQGNIEMSGSGTGRLEVTGSIFVSDSGSFNYITASHIDTDSDSLSIGGESLNKTLVQNIKRQFSPSALSPSGRAQATDDLYVDGVVSSSAAISTLSHITASGNISASGTIQSTGNISSDGTIYGKQRQITHHNYYDGDPSEENFIPFNYIVENTSLTYTNQIVAPYDGRVIKVIVHTDHRFVDAVLKIYTDGSVSGTSPSAAIPQNGSTTFSTFTESSGNANFSAGDLVAISITPDADPGNLFITVVWEYDIFT